MCNVMTELCKIWDLHRGVEDSDLLGCVNCVASLGWVHTCDAAYRNTVSWQCVRDSCPRDVSKVGYAVTLRAFFGVLSVFGRCIKGMIRLQPEQMWTCNGTLHVHTCSGRNRIISLMPRPNTDSTLIKPVTLPHNRLLIHCAGTSPVRTVTIRCYDTR
jgi:hypothetical protein